MDKKSEKNNTTQRIAIVGSRYYRNYQYVYKKFSEILKDLEIDSKDVIIVSGGASGVDTTAKKIAKNIHSSSNNLVNYKEYNADWKEYGRAAGPIRNKLIVNESDIIIAFPYKASRETTNTINLTKKWNSTKEGKENPKKLYIYRITDL